MRELTLIPSPDRVLLRNISWQSYQLLIRDFEGDGENRVIKQFRQWVRSAMG